MGPAAGPTGPENIDGRCPVGQIRGRMAAPVRFYYDYVDPGSWLVERIVAEQEARLGIVVERIPFEVTPPPRALVDPRGEDWRRFWEGARAMAVEEGVALGIPRIVPWTRKAHELALHALGVGRFDEVHRALYTAFLVEGHDLGRVDVLMDVAQRAGLDLGAARPVLDVDKHADAVTAARARAEREGVRGVPTLLAEPTVVAGRAGFAEHQLEGFRGRAATVEFLERAAAR